MKYLRPGNKTPISKEKKKALLKDYFEFYRQVSKTDPEQLNIKIPREAFSELLNQIGLLLLKKSGEAASSPGMIHDFLESNTLPGELNDLLPKEFRAFCLGLNALKQWVAAEQAATDRYLLGGVARALCRDVAKTCVITNLLFEGNSVELHHPARDGRPPIPVSKSGHSQIEGQTAGDESDPHLIALRTIKREGNRSWIMLKIGCESLVGIDVKASTPKVLASSRTFARRASEKTGLSYEEILDWLTEKGYVENIAKRPIAQPNIESGKTETKENRLLGTLKKDSSSRNLRWNLNLNHAWYSTQVPIEMKQVSVEFGIKNIDGKKLDLGLLELNLEELFRKKYIAVKDSKYRVTIYYDRPNFYICQGRTDNNRQHLELKYPTKKSI